MMFCGKCGSQLTDGVCLSCSPVQKNNTKKRMRLLVGIFAILGLIAGYFMYQNKEIKIIRYYGTTEYSTQVYDEQLNELYKIGRAMVPVPNGEDLNYSVNEDMSVFLDDNKVVDLQMTKDDLFFSESGLVNKLGDIEINNELHNVSTIYKTQNNYNFIANDGNYSSDNSTQKMGAVNSLGKWVDEIKEVDEYSYYSYFGAYKILLDLDDKTSEVKDFEGNTLLKCDDGLLLEIDKGVFVIINSDDDDYKGMITLDNERLVLPEKVKNFSLNRLITVNKEVYIDFSKKNDYSKDGIMNSKGEVIIEPIYSDIEILSEKEGYLKVVDNNDKVGVINLKGEVVLESDFTDVKSVSNGKFVVTKNKKDGLITSNGDWLIEPSYRSIRRFNKGLAPAKQGSDSGFGVINENGEWVVEPQYNNLYGIKNGYAIIQNEDDYSSVLNIKDNHKLFEYKEIIIKRIMSDNMIYGIDGSADFENSRNIIKDFNGDTKVSDKDMIFKVTWTVPRKEAKNF